MARVPSLDAPQAALQPGFSARLPDATDERAAARTGALAIEMGQQTQNDAQAEADRLLREQDMANRLRVDDARNQLTERVMTLAHDTAAGYRSLRGITALERPKGRALADEYGGHFDTARDDILGKLGNARQKELFGAVAQDMRTRFMGDVLAHEQAQFNDYALSVREGTIKTAQQAIALDYRDPEKTANSVASLEAAAFEKARLQGKSALEAQAEARAEAGKAHRVAIEAALQDGDVFAAAAHLKRYASGMDAESLLAANRLLAPEIDSRRAVGMVGQAFAEMRDRIAPTDMDRAFGILLKYESGGRQFQARREASFESPTPVTSPKGALGIAQIMPDTGPEAAKLAGLPWDPEKLKTDESYNRALGRAYFEKQLRDFGGSLPQAFAAYNAGPQRTRDALAEAEKDGGNWLNKLPDETQSYVRDNMESFQRGAGAPPPASLAEIEEHIRAAFPDASAKQIRLARDEAEARLKAQEQDRKQREEATTAEAMRAVMANGGRFSALPASLRASLPPDRVEKIMDFARRVARGDDSTNLAVYQELADPAKLRGLSDNAFFALRTELSESDFKRFADERAKAAGGGAGGPGDLNTEAIRRGLDDRLRMMGLDPSPSDKDTAALQRVGAIRRFVDQSILASQKGAGKRFNDAETEAALDDLFAKTVSSPNLLWGSTSAPMLGLKPGDIPSKERTALKEVFRKHGVDEPTDADLLRAWWAKVASR